MRGRVWSVVSCSWVHQEPSSSGRAMVWGTATSWNLSHTHHFYLFDFFVTFFICIKAVVFYLCCFFVELSSCLPLFKAPVLVFLSSWILILEWRSSFSLLCLIHCINVSESSARINQNIAQSMRKRALPGSGRSKRELFLTENCSMSSRL